MVTNYLMGGLRKTILCFLYNINFGAQDIDIKKPIVETKKSDEAVG